MTQTEFNKDVKDGMKSWEKEGSAGIPVYYLYYYLPTSSRLSSTDIEDWARHHIWDFKDGENSEEVGDEIIKVLKHFFLEDTLDMMTFVCIPASTEDKNKERYEWFSSYVASECNMWDGFDHITLRYDRDAAHLGGDSNYSNLKFDRSFFNGKNIILFDDIITSGTSIQKMAHKLRLMGANVLGAITLGRTVRHHHGTDPYDAGNWDVKRAPRISGRGSSGATDSAHESARMYSNCRSVSRVASARGLAESTVYGHLFSTGTLNPHDYITATELSRAYYVYDEGGYEFPSQQLDQFLDTAAKAAFFYIKRNR